MDYPYEGSDEASESELLEKSLSIWKGWGTLETDPGFRLAPLDLHTASSIGLYDCVSAYIASGDVDINRPNNGSWTPLMYASYIGHDNIVNLLLDAGAKVELCNAKGASALMLAASCGNESIAYFLVQQGADIKNTDLNGWSALFYAVYAGHQTVVQFLLGNGASVNSREPRLGITPFMMAAAEGHEVIVSTLLEHGADVNVRNKNGEMARSLAQMNGHVRVINLLDSYGMSGSGILRTEAGLNLSVDLSSSDETYQRPNRPHPRSSRSKVKNPSIRDGPETLAKLLNERRAGKQGTVCLPNIDNFGNESCLSRQPPDCGGVGPRGFTEDFEPCCSRDGNYWMGQTAASAAITGEDPAFCISGALTIKSNSSCSNSSVSGSAGSSSSGSGLAPALSAVGQRGSHRPANADNQSSEASSLYSLPPTPSSNSSENGIFAGAVSDQLARMISEDDLRRGGFGPDRMPFNVGLTSAGDTPGMTTHSCIPAAAPPPGYSAGNVGYQSIVTPLIDAPREMFGDATGRNDALPFRDLAGLLESLGLRSKYFHVFEEQDVDLRVFLTLTDSDLKEVGIKLMGPRRKMTNAIARWHSQARPFTDSLEQVYADRVETAMQEMAIQLQEAIVKRDELDAQVVQERELRSVVEGCLMDDRKTYQQLLSLVSEARKLCHNMRQLYDSARSCQTELIRRVQSGPCPFAPTDTSFDGPLSDQLSHQLGVGQVRHGLGGRASPPPQPDENPLVSAITSSMIPASMTDSDVGQQDLTQLVMGDLLSMLSHSSHRLGRAVAMATNNMDQLIDGQTVNFSPNSSGSSLP